MVLRLTSWFLKGCLLSLFSSLIPWFPFCLGSVCWSPLIVCTCSPGYLTCSVTFMLCLPYLLSSLSACLMSCWPVSVSRRSASACPLVSVSQLSVYSVFDLWHVIRIWILDLWFIVKGLVDTGFMSVFWVRIFGFRTSGFEEGFSVCSTYDLGTELELCFCELFGLDFSTQTLDCILGLCLYNFLTLRVFCREEYTQKMKPWL